MFEKSFICRLLLVSIWRRRFDFVITPLTPSRRPSGARRRLLDQRITIETTFPVVKKEKKTQL